MKFEIINPILPGKLCEELANAGFPGRVFTDAFEPFQELTDEQAVQVRALIDAHNPAPLPLTRAQKLATLGLTEEQAAFRLVQVKGVDAPLWAKTIVAARISDIDTAIM